MPPTAANIPPTRISHDFAHALGTAKLTTKYALTKTNTENIAIAIPIMPFFLYS